ncbi:MAG: glycosyltransferase family 39 protein [Acidobacteria bacterium]|nr:glycosyltransferase family 39 protein [Acidobacteriota bacterium]
MMRVAALVGLTVCGAGFAAAFVARPRSAPMLFIATTVATSLGVSTLVMFWLLVLRAGRVDRGSILLCCALVALAGAVACVLTARPIATVERPADRRRTLSWVAVPVAITCVAIGLNAWLWPFGDGDALAVYGPLGRVIVASASLPVGERLYEAYPPLVPLLYAAVEWLHGSPSEAWSRVLTTTYALGCVVAAWHLARDMASVRAAWLASLLVISTPAFARWASSGYADLPAACYVTLATLFAWRWWTDRERSSAVACGLACGLALWTKNSVITLGATAVLLPLAWAWTGRPRRDEGRRSAADLALGALAGVAVAGPWYLRNLVVFGFALPPTAWTDQAQPGLASLLVGLAPAHGFGVLGWLSLVLAGVVVLRVARDRSPAGAQAALVGAVCGPFFLAWWWFASYDPRFLVTIVPVVAAYGGAVVDGWMARASARRWWGRPAAAIAILAVALSWGVTLRRALEHKRHVLRAPWMDDVERHRLQVGGLYEVGRLIDELPPGTRVAGVPTMARYYIAPERLGDVRWVGSPPFPDGRLDAIVTRDGRAEDDPVAGSSARPGTCDGEVILSTADGFVVCLVTVASDGVGGDGERGSW